MRIIWLVLIMLSLAVVGGCIKVNVDADSLVDRYAGPYLGAAGDDEAVEAAREAARKEGVDPGEYTLSTRQIQKDYWVVFDHIEGAAKPRRWPWHFSVRVGPDVQAQLYKDR